MMSISVQISFGTYLGQMRGWFRGFISVSINIGPPGICCKEKSQRTVSNTTRNILMRGRLWGSAGRSCDHWCPLGLCCQRHLCGAGQGLVSLLIWSHVASFWRGVHRWFFVYSICVMPPAYCPEGEAFSILLLWTWPLLSSCDIISSRLMQSDNHSCIQPFEGECLLHAGCWASALLQQQFCCMQLLF